MGFKTIELTKEGSIGIIMLNRPKHMNALNMELIGEVSLAIDEIERDEKICAVIITGSKKFFAAGADIKEVVDIGTPVEAHRFLVKAQGLFRRIEEMQRPVIAAVGGFALGGGCELALACDIRIAAENAMFGQPEINLGMIPGGGGTQRLPRLIGIGMAKELLYTGEPINALEAHRVGLVNRVVPIDTLMDEAKQMAGKLVRQPQIALRITKMVVNEGINMDITSALAHEARCFEMLFSTEDQKEGVKAFVGKRKPVFRGR